MKHSKHSFYIGLTCSLMVCGALLAGSGQAWAAVDDMPAPRKAPRIKVQQQRLTVEESKGNRIVTGAASVIEAEKIKVGDTELRLFGVVMPQRAAIHGNEARAALETAFAEGEANCRVIARDKNWKLVGTCKTARTDDVSLAMIQQGWGVVARGSVQQTDVADIYLAAEAKAQVQKLGMWAETAAPAGSANATTATGTTAIASATDNKDNAVSSVVALSQATKAETITALPPSSADTSVAAATPPASQATMTPSTVADLAPKATSAGTTILQAAAEPSTGWMWFVGLVPMGVMILYGAGQIALRRYEYQQERKALAAALRGELMAARAICVSRADTLGHGADTAAKLSSLWPRLRSNVYQAYVGRIGLLGPDLSRRVASLYGQFSDYAQFYTTRPTADMAGKIDAATVQQTLFTIIDHIEDTLNNLQKVETTGESLSRFIATRTSAAGAQAQRLGQRFKPEKLNYVEAEIVEDQLAIQSAQQNPASAVATLGAVLAAPHSAAIDKAATVDKAAPVDSFSFEKSSVASALGEPINLTAPTIPITKPTEITADKTDASKALTPLVPTTASLAITRTELQPEQPPEPLPPLSALPSLFDIMPKQDTSPETATTATLANLAATHKAIANADADTAMLNVVIATSSETSSPSSETTLNAAVKAEIAVTEMTGVHAPKEDYYDFRSQANRLAKS